MDISTLAENLTDFLAPFLPYLEQPNEAAPQQAVEQFGSDAWKQAQAAWSKLRPRLLEAPPVKGVDRERAWRDARTRRDLVAYLARMPQDAIAQANLRSQLEGLLSQDAQLASDLATLRIEHPLDAPGPGTRGETVGGDVVSSVIMPGEGYVSQSSKYSTTAFRDAGTVRVVVNSPDAPVKVRSGPSSQYPQVAQAKHGTLLTALEPVEAVRRKVGQQDQWLEVRTPEGVSGYTAASYLRQM